MAHCHQCGEELDEGARFCAECGAPVEALGVGEGAGAAAVEPADATDAAAAPAAAVRAAAAPRGDGRSAGAERPRRSTPAPASANPSRTVAMGRQPEPSAAPADATRVLRSRPSAGSPVGSVRPVTAPVAVGSGSTRRMPPVATPQARPAGSHRPVTYSARNTVRKSRVPLVAGIVIAALLVGAGAFAAITVANRADGGPDAPATSFLPGEKAADAPAPAQTAPEPEEERDPATPEKLPAAEVDPQAAATLGGFYDGLSAVDRKVSAAAQEFNGLYISGSLEEREAALGRCEELRADIAEARDEVVALGIPAESPYHGCAEDIAALYEDLYQRIDVIVKSWEIDVGFDDPTGHSDEICAPMAAANEGGVSKYLKDYQERYPGADPAKVQG